MLRAQKDQVSLVSNKLSHRHARLPSTCPWPEPLSQAPSTHCRDIWSMKSKGLTEP